MNKKFLMLNVTLLFGLFLILNIIKPKQSVSFFKSGTSYINQLIKNKEVSAEEHINLEENKSSNETESTVENTPVKEPVMMEYIIRHGESYYINEADFPVSSIKFNNQYYNVGDYYYVKTDSPYWQYNLQLLQNHIDLGYFGTDAPFLVDDEWTTIIFGHNPGISSNFANPDLIKVGDTITIKDDNGNIGVYQLTDTWSQPATLLARGKIQEYADARGYERIIIQYCVDYYGNYYQYQLYNRIQ